MNDPSDKCYQGRTGRMGCSYWATGGRLSGGGKLSSGSQKIKYLKRGERWVPWVGSQMNHDIDRQMPGMSEGLSLDRKVG